MRKRYLLVGLAGAVGFVALGAGVISAAAPPPPPPGDAMHGSIWGPEGMMSHAQWDDRRGRRGPGMGPMFCGPEREERLGRVARRTAGRTRAASISSRTLARASSRLSHWVRVSWLVTTDHKRIGILYIGTSLAFFVLAGIMAMLMRLQLAQADDFVGGFRSF